MTASKGPAAQMEVDPRWPTFNCSVWRSFVLKACSTEVMSETTSSAAAACRTLLEWRSVDDALFSMEHMSTFLAVCESNRYISNWEQQLAYISGYKIPSYDSLQASEKTHSGCSRRPHAISRRYTSRPHRIAHYRPLMCIILNRHTSSCQSKGLRYCPVNSFCLFSDIMR